MAASLPSCHLPVCQTNLAARLYLLKISPTKFPSFENRKIRKLTHMPVRSTYTLILIFSCFDKMFFNMCTNMVITTTSASFCALVGECQQKFLLGGAFYSPNERFSPNVPLPSLNVIFPDIIITA